MIVLDASALVPILVDLPEATAPVLDVMSGFVDERRAAPQVIDLEAAQALRRLSGSGRITEHASALAFDDLLTFPLERLPHQFLMPRVWELRHNLTAYDAVYLALAESMDATLVTRDRAFLAVDTSAEVLLAA